MSKILGKDVTLSIVVNASPQEIILIGCARTATLITNTVTAPKSTVGSGIWQEFTALSMNWSASVNGLATVGENMDMQTLRSMQFTLQPVIVSFKEATVTGDIYYSGFAIIQSIQTSGNYADAETYDVQLQGTGELIFEQAVYGTYPTDITAVLIAGPQLLISWNAPAFPVPDSYTVRVIDSDLNTTTYYPGIVTGSTTVPIDPDHNYRIAVQSNYNTLGSSVFSPDTIYP
jgi:predicted secreted protein